MAKSLSEADTAFLRGVLLGLQHMHGHDQEVMYHECVRDAGARELVAVAKQEQALEWSGLVKYGYCSASGRFKSAKSKTN